jgi:hypothetical protein
MKKVFLEAVESGFGTSLSAIIPVSDVQEKEVKCSHRFTPSQIRAFAMDEMDRQEAHVLRAMINSCHECEEEARSIAIIEGLEDSFIDQMEW